MKWTTKFQWKRSLRKTSLVINWYKRINIYTNRVEISIWVVTKKKHELTFNIWTAIFPVPKPKKYFLFCQQYIYSHHRQTLSLYHNSSEWLETRDASSWDRNPPNFQLGMVSNHSAISVTYVSWEFITRIYICIYVYVCVCVYIYIYIYIYIYVYIRLYLSGTKETFDPRYEK